MVSLLYKAIKTERQYNEYTKKLIRLLDRKERGKDYIDVADLLTALLEYYDEERKTTVKSDPVDILHFLIEENEITVDQMAKYLRIGDDSLSDILNYRLGFSKPIIRKLSERFKMRYDAFSKDYILVNAMPDPAKRIARNNKVKS